MTSLLPVNDGPEFARWINPVLRALGELGGSARPREVIERVAKNEHVPDDILDETNPAGGQRFSNQVHWARFYLAEAGLIDRSRRGVWKLTESGATTGQLSQVEINELVENVRESSRNIDSSRLIAVAQVPQPVAVPIPTPDATEINVSDTLAPDEDDVDYRTKLLALLQTLPPAGFERLCQRLLREAGFEQVTVTGKSGDGGIDGHGVLALNSFVSFRVLFQCKRYAGSVVPSHVRDFRGAMQGRADKGLILTTGSFTAEARREATRDGAPPIELVDGEKLVNLFASLELGLCPIMSYDLDEHFFEEYKK